jgi:hypothetical protein
LFDFFVIRKADIKSSDVNIEARPCHILNVHLTENGGSTRRPRRRIRSSSNRGARSRRNLCCWLGTSDNVDSAEVSAFVSWVELAK